MELDLPYTYSKEDTPIFSPASGFEARYEHVFIL
jgi:hypothetical protein